MGEDHYQAHYYQKHERIEQEADDGALKHAMLTLIEMAFAPRYGLTKAHDGMRQPRRVTQPEVEKPCDNKRYC